MARTIASDKYHNYAFQVIVGGDMLSVQGGFTAMALPEVTVDMVEYRPGDASTFKEKYPGMATLGTNLVLTRGLVQKASAFGEWLMKWTKGENYRTEITLLHFHGEKGKARKYTLFNAFPMRWKTAADLDAGSSDVTTEELEIAYEFFHLEEDGVDMVSRSFPQVISGKGGNELNNQGNYYTQNQ